MNIEYTLQNTNIPNKDWTGKINVFWDQPKTGFY